MRCTHLNLPAKTPVKPPGVPADIVEEIFFGNENYVSVAVADVFGAREGVPGVR